MSDLNFASLPSVTTDYAFIVQSVMDNWNGQVKFDQFGRQIPLVDWENTSTDDLRASLDETHSIDWHIAIMDELDARYDGW